MSDQHGQRRRPPCEPQRESHLALLVEHHRAVLAEHRLSRRERRRLETREEILQAAREIYAESGAVDFSLSEIARRLGFTPAALYRYFDSKDDLIKALAERAMAGLAEALARVSPALPPDERAVEMGMAYLEFARANPHDIALVALHEALQLTHAGGHAGLEALVVGVFREGAAQGVFSAASEEDVELMVYGAWSLVHGMAVLLERQPSAAVKRLRLSRQRQLLQAFVNGLKADWSAPSSRPRA
jgi:AcrR family transcriptional regulator